MEYAPDTGLLLTHEGMGILAAGNPELRFQGVVGPCPCDWRPPLRIVTGDEPLVTDCDTCCPVDHYYGFRRWKGPAVLLGFRIVPPKENP